MSKNKTIRRNSITWRMLEYLYHAQFMSFDDLRMLARDSYSSQISDSLKRLKEYGFIEDSKDILPCRTVWITKLGRLYVCDKEGENSYNSKNSDKITCEYDLARRRNAVEGYVDLCRARTMLKFNEVAVHESDKPSLKDLVNCLVAKDYQFAYWDNGDYPPYKTEITEKEKKDILTKGVFYSKREITEWFKDYISESTDVIRMARFKGIVFNSRRIFMVYVQPFRTGTMFKLNYSDAIVKKNLEERLNIELSKVYQRSVKVQALIVCNQDALVYSMATGWKKGVLKPEAKERILKQYDDQKTRKLRYREKQIVIDPTTNHEIAGTVEIPLIPSMPKSEIDNSNYQRERNKLQEWFSAHNGVFSYNDPLFDGKYVVPANSNGLTAMRYALFKTDEEIYLDGVSKYRDTMPVTFENVQSDDAHNWQVGDEVDPVIYMPVYEIDRLHALSCDGNLYKGSQTVTVICDESQIKAISHSIRKNVKGIGIDDMEPFSFVPQYNYDGYVTNMTDPYEHLRVPAKEKKKRVKNKARGSYVTNDDTVQMIKRAAAREGISINEFITRTARAEAEKVLNESKSSNQKYPKNQDI